MPTFDSKPLLCKRCGNVVGVTSATTLVLGAVRIRRSVTLECQCCQQSFMWYPSPAKEDFKGEYAAKRKS